MRDSICIHVKGNGARDTAHALCRRLIELGRIANVAQDSAQVPADEQCTVLADCEQGQPADHSLDFQVSQHDTPDFAAEKALDRLAAEGLVDLEDQDYSPEEEERIRKRLAELGYIE